MFNIKVKIYTKRIIGDYMKKFLVTILSMLMLVVASLSLVGCADIKTAKITFVSYQGSLTNSQELVVEVDLYRHLAPKTVDHIISVAKSGYYNDAILYKLGTDATSQIMVGEYLYSSLSADKFVKNDREKSYVKGEFTKAGVTGNNLTSDKYSVGLWRIFNENANYGGSAEKLDVDSVYNSGSATLFMPTADMQYTNYFAIFARINKEESKQNFDKIVTAMEVADNYVSYTKFWTGTDPENLTEHLTTTQAYEDGVEAEVYTNVFDPNEATQSVYNKTNYYFYAPQTISVLKEARRIVIKNIQF